MGMLVTELSVGLSSTERGCDLCVARYSQGTTVDAGDIHVWVGQGHLLYKVYL